MDAVQESLPPARYKETVSTLLSWLQQCEAKLAAPSAAVTELPIMEQRLKDIQVRFCLSAYRIGLIQYVLFVEVA